MKLHLGCGDMILPGFMNCDLYSPQAQVKCDVMHLPYEDDSIEVIYNAHLIEHFDFFEAYHLLAEWKRVLIPGGILAVETPNFEALCKALVEAPEHDRVYLYDQFFGKPWVPGHAHKFLYTPAQLWGTLKNAGFNNIVTVPALRYIGMEKICQRMECTK
jgi:predicted SAM-dependent methyltransferase